MEAYKNNKAAMSRRDKEALLYAKEKVERARGYIEAIKVAPTHAYHYHASHYRLATPILPRRRRGRPEADDSEEYCRAKPDSTSPQYRV